MPWINLTVREGAFSREQKDEAMRRLTDALMSWEDVPDTDRARAFMRGWIYEVDALDDYRGGSNQHALPYYFVEVRIPAGRLDVLKKSGVQRDFTRVLLETEGSPLEQKHLERVWVTIQEVERDDWSIGGHTDWLRSYESALD